MSLLAIYLNDHLAGAAGGVELVEARPRLQPGNRVRRRSSAELAAEIEADRDALEQLMEELGISRDRIKGVLAWTGEKVGRLKLNGSLLSYSPLSRLVELEGLVIGVTGKAVDVGERRGDPRAARRPDRLRGADRAGGLAARRELRSPAGPGAAARGRSTDDR